MERAEVRVLDRPLGDVSPYLFGALTEHFGYGVYGGMWDRERDVPRADVMAATRAMGASMFRYPGGCFSDWYHWRDGVGPKDRRPTHESTYWTEFRLEDLISDEMARQFGPVETNAFGTDELLRYCLDADVEPMLVANFGSGTPEEAADWVAYCNRDRAAPRPVRWWSVGNETYGSWEIGHCPPDEYGRRFVEYARAMRAVDPEIRMVAVGCADRSGAYAGTWNEQVLQEAGDEADALSVHYYFPGPWMGRDLRDDEPDSLQVVAGSADLGLMLDGIIEQVDAVVGTERKLPLSLDEWNMWVTWEDLLHTNRRLVDAVFFAGCYNRMLERADRVRFAAISHLVNCMAPIQTRGERHFGTSSYLVAALYRRAVRRRAVAVELTAGSVRVPAFRDTQEVPMSLAHMNAPEPVEVPAVDAAATVNDGGATVFLANRRLDAPAAVEVSGLPPGAEGRFRYVWGPDPFARNDEGDPARLGYAEQPARVEASGTCLVEIPPHTAGALIVERV